MTESRRQRLARHWHRLEPFVWAAALATILVVQWPVFKGWYFKLTGSTSPAAAVTWRTDLPAAMAEARAADKRVLVAFTAAWCPSCIAMAHDVWPDTAVARAVDTACVPVKVDVDHDTVLGARYGIESIPALVLLDGDGRVIGRHEGFLPRAGVLRFLDEHHTP